MEAKNQLTSIEEKIQQKEQQFNQKYNFEEQAIQSRLKEYENLKRKTIDQQLEFFKLECNQQKSKYEQKLSSILFDLE